jgi:hypothetical protein
MLEMISRQRYLTVAGDNFLVEGHNVSNKLLTLIRTQSKAPLSLSPQSHSKITVRMSRITAW